MFEDKIFKNQEAFTREKLEQTLEKHSIPVSEWGNGAAKTIDHLLKELDSGEVLLSEDKKGELIREVFSVSINVYFENKENKERFLLVEDKQVFKDGRERKRSSEVKDCSIAEKIKPGEDIYIAALRGIQEELGISEDIPVEKKQEIQKIRESNSYPGLKSRYNLCYFDAEMPENLFKENGYVEEQNDKSTFFVWKQI